MKLRRRTNIIKLGGYPSDDESESISSDEEELIIKKPKRMLEKITNESIETNIATRLFNYDENEILVLIDKDKKAWYKGKDMASILEYKNVKAAITHNVSKRYKKSYADMGYATVDPPSKIDPQTIFISNSGLFQLVAKSRKPEAIKLWEYITEEILPTLFATGTYTLSPTGIQIEELNKSFYDDNFLSDYANKNAIYLAYIGKYKGKHILKFGKTKDFVNRDLKQHRKTFKKFNVLKIWETLACDHVEDKIKADVEAYGLAVTMTKKELQIDCTTKNIRELIQINEIKNHNKIMELIDNAINTTVLPKEQKYIDQIKDLKHANEILQIKLSECKERLIDKNDLIQILKKKSK